jgi:hypothetical protein
MSVNFTRRLQRGMLKMLDMVASLYNNKEKKVGAI